MLQVLNKPEHGLDIKERCEHVARLITDHISGFVLHLRVHTVLFLRRLLLLAFENGGRGGLNPYQTGNKLSDAQVLF